mgnify:CR=1 FL=1
MYTSIAVSKFERFGKTSFVTGAINSSVYIGSAVSTYGIAAINENFCTTLEKTARKHKGKTPLKMLIIDRDQNLSLTMMSQTLKVDPKSCIEALKDIPEIIEISPNIRQ